MIVDAAQAKAIFLEALEKAGPERTAYLDGVCAACPEVRRRVDAMLQAHEASGELLSRSPVDMLADDAATSPTDDAASAEDCLAFLAPPSRPETLGRLGHYHVQEAIGKGGFGIVVKAFD